MNRLKKFFSTPKKIIISLVCAVAIIVLIGFSSAYAAETIAKSSAIGADNAQYFAFADAGVDPVLAKNVRTEFDFEMGQFVYEIEFTADGTEYEYWIKASNGTVLKKKVEIVTLDGTNLMVTAKITMDKAKEIALLDAGYSESQVIITEAKLDVENGISVYEISFNANNVEYEYEINAETGAIYSKSKETVVREQTESKQQNEKAEQAPVVKNEVKTTDKQTENQAIAPDDSSKTESTSGEKSSKSKSGDKDSSKNKESGKNKGKNKATPTPVPKSTTATPIPEPSSKKETNNFIGLDSAKSIAVSKAQLNEADVTFKKAKLDIDDGIAEYEIEFYYKGFEYEVDIDAITGKILDYDCEKDD